jgi:hypothetical protein
MCMRSMRIAAGTCLLRGPKFHFLTVTTRTTDTRLAKQFAICPIVFDIDANETPITKFDICGSGYVIFSSSVSRGFKWEVFNVDICSFFKYTFDVAKCIHSVGDENATLAGAWSAGNSVTNRFGVRELLIGVN